MADRRALIDLDKQEATRLTNPKRERGRTPRETLLHLIRWRTRCVLKHPPSLTLRVSEAS